MNKQISKSVSSPKTTVGFEFAISTAVVAVRVSASPPDCIAHIPTVFISVVNISRKHCLFLRFNKNSSFSILNTVFSVNSAGLPNFPFERCR